ncbi:MAG: DUF255 domain-containing protein [Planctomycetaceae bacterium]|nr:DUF255 domain-containing protein [Planctomycetaceae bacterium]
MKIINSLAVFGFVLLGTASLWAGQGVQWETDFKTAMNLAQETNRFVLIHFYGDQCPPCRMMDKDVFPQQAVADALTPYFVPLKVNTEENSKAVQNLNITSIPMDLIVTPQREIIFRRKGGCSAEQYVEELLSVVRTLQIQQEAEMSDAERLQIAQVQNQPQNPPQVPIQAETTSVGLQVPQAQTTHVPPAVAESPVVSQTDLLETPFQSTPELFVPIADELAVAVSQEEADFSIAAMPLTIDDGPAETTGADLSIPNLQTPEGRENWGYESPYVLDGFCPVELQDHEQWVAGKTEFSLHYRDRFFLFSSKEAMNTFAKNPYHYTPVAMGEDVVQMLQGGQKVKGKRHYGAWYQGRIYLFTTQENYDAFSQRPSYFADFALKLESALGQMQVANQEIGNRK